MFSGIPIALCIINFLILIILEILYYKKNQNKTVLIKQTFEESLTNFKSNRNASFQHLTIKQIKDEQKSGKIKFVFYENLLLDVTKYAETHPGGRNMLLDNLYSDVSRYIVGNQAYSTQIPAYDHNIQTCIYAVKSLAFGIYSDLSRLVIKGDKNTYLNDNMILDNRNNIAEATTQLNFSHEGFKFPIFVQGVNWFGRHFAVSSTDLDKTRYYSICLCLNEKIQQRINILLNNVLRLENKESINSAKLKQEELYNNHISFFVRVYDFPKGLSNYLNNIQPKANSRINIRGPIVIYNLFLHRFFLIILLLNKINRELGLD